MARYRKLSVALLLYTTLLCISQITYDVSANEVTDVQDAVHGSVESHQMTTTGDPGRPNDHIQDTASSTGESLGYYQRYKKFVAKHNKAFTIVFGVLFVISLVVAIWVCASKGQNGEVAVPIMLGVVVFGIILYKLYGHKVMAYFRSMKGTVDALDSST